MRYINPHLTFEVGNGHTPNHLVSAETETCCNTSNQNRSKPHRNWAHRQLRRRNRNRNRNSVDL